MRLFHLSLRLRLTLVFSASMFVLLSGVGTLVYLRTKSNLDDAISADLRARTQDLAGLVRLAGGPGAGRQRLDRLPDPSFQVLTATGTVLGGSLQAGDRSILPAAELRRASEATILVEQQERRRLLARPLPGHRGIVIVVWASLLERERTLETLAGALLIGGPVALVLASIAGYLLATGAVRPLDSMRAHAARMSSHDDPTRLPLPATRDEVYRLGDTLNSMLDRLHEGVARERQFVDDASHELRTPLALMRTELDLALEADSPTTPDEHRAVLVELSEEVDRLTQLTDGLLMLARADKGVVALHATEVEVAAVVGRVLRRFDLRLRRAAREVTVTVPVDLRARVDPLRLEQALTNLVDNALRHGRGAIVIRAERTEDGVEVRVSNDGPPLSGEFLARAFDRFSREGETGEGFGLGLAIVQSVARSHGGDAHIANTETGVDVWVTLPDARS